MNSTKDRKERVGRMLLMHANNREDIKEAFAGDIVALAGLKDYAPATRCATRRSPSSWRRWNSLIRLSRSRSSRRSKADQEKMGVALATLVEEDPSFRVSHRSGNRPDHHQGHGRAASGNHGRHRMKREFKVEANVGAPQVAYRETITRPATVDYTHKKQTGGHGQFARIKIVARAAEPGAGFEFENEVVGGSVPKEFIPGVEKGLEGQLTLRRYRRISRWSISRRSLIDGAYHDVDSSALAFEIARARRFPGGAAESRPGAARADHEGRGGDAGRLYRRRHRRSEFAARPDPGQDMRGNATSSPRWCRSPRCSAMSTSCAP